MPNPAVLQNVADAYERPLTPDEQRVVPNWLDQAWRLLSRTVPAVEARMMVDAPAASALTVADVTDVLVAMVVRVLRNPDGLRTWNGDDYGQTVDSALSTGQLYVSDAERDSLMPRAAVAGAYSLIVGR